MSVPDDNMDIAIVGLAPQGQELRQPAGFGGRATGVYHRLQERVAQGWIAAGKFVPVRRGNDGERIEDL